MLSFIGYTYHAGHGFPFVGSTGASLDWFPLTLAAVLIAAFTIAFVLFNVDPKGWPMAPDGVPQPAQSGAPVPIGDVPAGTGGPNAEEPVVIEALMFIPETLTQAVGISDRTAIVSVIKVIGTKSSGDTRRVLTQEEADALNADRAQGSIKPEFRAGQWVGGYGSISTLYEARFEWPDGSVEMGVLSALGGRHADGTLLQFGQVKLPAPGRSYVMFLRGSDGDYGALPVSFELASGRIGPHNGNLGWEQLALTADEFIAMAEAERVRQAANPR